VYSFDSSRGALIGASNSAKHLILPAASGPRHLAFHPNGMWVYVLCELDGNLVFCEWDSEEGRLSAIQTVAALQAGVQPARAHHSGNAHVLVSKDGCRVYATTRTDNAIVVFAVDAASGRLNKLQTVPTEGVCPRNFVLDYTNPTAAYLRLGNQDSQNIVSFQISEADGTLLAPSILPLDGICPNVLTLPLEPPK